MEKGGVRNSQPIFPAFVHLRVSQAAFYGSCRLRGGDHHVHPCGVGISAHPIHVYVRRVHGSGMSRCITGRPCLLDGGCDARRARVLGNIWSLSSSCLWRLVCLAHAAACRPSASSLPWHVGPCPSRSARRQSWPAPGASLSLYISNLSLSLSLFVSLSPLSRQKNYTHIHTYIHTYIYIYIYADGTSDGPATFLPFEGTIMGPIVRVLMGHLYPGAPNACICSVLQMSWFCEFSEAFSQSAVRVVLDKCQNQCFRKSFTFEMTKRFW